LARFFPLQPLHSLFISSPCVGDGLEQYSCCQTTIGHIIILGNIGRVAINFPELVDGGTSQGTASTICHHTSLVIINLESVCDLNIMFAW
jgi:hypothetical protein